MVSGTKEIKFKVQLLSGKTLELAVRNIIADKYSDMIYLALGITEAFIYDIYAKIETYTVNEYETECDYFYNYLSDIEGWQDGTGFISSYKKRGHYVNIDKYTEENEETETVY